MTLADLTLDEINIILNTLQEAAIPYKLSNPLIQKIVAQGQAQLQAELDEDKADHASSTDQLDEEI